MKHWTPRQIELLAALRARFLEGTAGEADYWTSDEELALYDQTFAARIGWKIDAVLRAVSAIGWQPRSRRLFDWGCGTGIATRRVLNTWPQFTEAAFHDRSARAANFARAQSQLPHGETLANRDTLLLISHVLNELSPTGLDELLAHIRNAGEVIWVEAGTHANSRHLIEVRERLLAEPDPPHVVAPCTHQARCGLLTPENTRHWCHHFAEPPREVFCDPRWEEWSRALGIDRRALPYSYLVLTRHEAPVLDGSSRVIGIPRPGKNHCYVLSCAAEGVTEPMLQKRDARELYRSFTKDLEWPPFRWQMTAGKITGGEPAK